MITSIGTRAEVQRVEQDDGEADVEQAQQAARGEHPQGQAPVASEVLALHGAMVAPVRELRSFPRHAVLTLH